MIIQLAALLTYKSLKLEDLEENLRLRSDQSFYRLGLQKVAAPIVGTLETVPAYTPGTPVPDMKINQNNPNLREMAREIAKKHGLDPDLFESLVEAESSFNPKAQSHVGAAGLTQLMPGTAKELGVADVWDPYQNLDGGARYLAKQLKRFGTIELALAAYNAGPGNVRKHGGIPPFKETQNYVAKITKKTAEKKAK